MRSRPPLTKPISGIASGIAGCCARAAEQRDELAPFHSITSSALASDVGETVRPSAHAVFIFNTTWNFVGCSTGRLEGAGKKLAMFDAPKQCSSRDRMRSSKYWKYAVIASTTSAPGSRDQFLRTASGPAPERRISIQLHLSLR
jgi:hypothetical protein